MGNDHLARRWGTKSTCRGIHYRGDRPRNAMIFICGMIRRLNRLRRDRSRFPRCLSLAGIFLVISIVMGGIPQSGNADELLKRPLPIDPDRQYTFAQSLYDTDSVDRMNVLLSDSYFDSRFPSSSGSVASAQPIVEL